MSNDLRDTTIPGTMSIAASTHLPDPEPAQLPDSSLDRAVLPSYPPHRIPNSLVPGRSAEGGVAGPQVGQSFGEPVTAQPPPPYSTMSVKESAGQGERPQLDQRFEDTYIEDSEDRDRNFCRTCFNDCLVHDGGCACVYATFAACFACMFCCCN